MLKELKEQTQELLNFGNSTEKAKGYGMMQIIKIIEENYYHKSCSVTWSVEDLKYQAELLKTFDSKLEFDESKYKKTLELMIKEHDANIGINWDVIGIYVMEHCKKRKNDNI